MSLDPIHAVIPRPADKPVEDAVASFLFTGGLMSRCAALALDDGETDALGFDVAEEGTVWVEFRPHDEEAEIDLRRALGLDDPEDPDGQCSHKKETSHDDGRWTCDRCGEDRTAAALGRLIVTIQEALARPEFLPDGHRLQAAAVLEASIWMTHAHRTAAYVAERTRAGYPEVLT